MSVTLNCADWNRECGIRAPSAAQPVQYSMIRVAKVNSEATANIPDGASNTSERYKNVCPSIVLLLLAGGPFAVFLVVALIVVLAFNFKAGRAFAHVGQEIVESFPSFANCNSSSPIVCITASIRILAPLSHGYPGAVGFGLGTAVSGKAQPAALLNVASAGFNDAHPKAVSANVFFGSAIAATKCVPPPLPVNLHRIDTNYDKSCESLPNLDRFSRRHNSVSALLCLAAGVQLQLTFAATPVSSFSPATAM